MNAQRHARGFTLIEVLIGATVLAVLMTLLASALFTLTRSARAGEARLDELDATHLVYGFLRRQFEAAIPLTERVDGNELVLFEGRAERLRFVGHLPAIQSGGLQFLDIALEPLPDGGQLTLRYRDAWPDVPFGAPMEVASSRALLRDVGRLRYEYYGNPDDDTPARWATEWLKHDRLPELVRMTLEYTSGTRTTLTAEVRVRRAVAQAALFREPPGGGR